MPPTTTRDRTLNQLQNVRPRLVPEGLYKRRIEFHKGEQDSPGEKEVPPKESGGYMNTGSGSQVASFYRSLVSTPTAADYSSEAENWCEECGSQIIDRERHHLSTVHLSSTATAYADSPAKPLFFGPEHTGYKYLVKHGWSPISKRGLGVEGREGSREPIKVQKKDDRVGIGAEQGATEHNSKVRRKEKIQAMTAKDSIKHYSKEKERRKRIAYEVLQQ